MPHLAGVLIHPCLCLANLCPLQRTRYIQSLRTLICQQGPYTDQMDIYIHNENTYVTSALTTPASTLLLCSTQLTVAIDTNPK